MKRLLCILLLVSLNTSGGLIIRPLTPEAGGGLSFVGSTDNEATDGGDVVLDLTNISGLAEGDLVWVAYTIAGNANVDMQIKTGTGWTEVTDQYADDSNDTNLGVYAKFMGETPDTSIEMEGHGVTSTSVVAMAMAFRGCDQLDVGTDPATGINSVLANPDPLDLSGAPGVWNLIVAAGAHTAGSQTFTAPTGYTTNWLTEGANDTVDATLAMGYNSSPTDPEDPAAVGFSTSDSTAYSWATLSAAMRPL